MLCCKTLPSHIVPYTHSATHQLIGLVMTIEKTELVALEHLEGTVCCAFLLDLLATCPACLSCTSPPVLSGFLQLFLNERSSNQDGFQVGTIDTLYSVLSLTLIGESCL